MKRALFLAWVGLMGLVGVVSAAQTAKGEPPKAQEELRVDLNHADATELSKLPGIGEQVAKRIIAYRKDHGPFEKTEELMNVRGIGEKTYLKLRPFLTLGPDKEPRKK